ncbi:CoA transferase subunit A [Luteococcus sp. Sow4_B9]|uniref:CoA transferase subunit A n=1 Tax=Luteococcus sp. Sow4_B9 TaxID=3438792 RepID=UPI003F957079
MVDKVVSSISEALEGLEEGMSVAVGGFGTCGAPAALIEGIIEKGVGGLTAYSNNPGTELDQIALGLSRAVKAGLVKRFCGSFVGYAKSVERQYLAGEMEVELIPQGSLVERMRAGGAGIPAFWTPSGAGTPVSDGGMPMRYDGEGNVVLVSEPKETRTFMVDGKEELCVMEEAIVTDFSLVHAWKGDREGNLKFRYTAENFNPVVGMCGKVTVAEVEELVEVGELEPGEIQLQGIFVDRVVALKPEEGAGEGAGARRHPLTLGRRGPHRAAPGAGCRRGTRRVDACRHRSPRGAGAGRRFLCQPGHRTAHHDSRLPAQGP